MKAALRELHDGEGPRELYDGEGTKGVIWWGGTEGVMSRDRGIAHREEGS